MDYSWVSPLFAVILIGLAVDGLQATERNRAGGSLL